jgi:L-asparaginase II
MRFQIEVQVWRGSIPESRHRVQMAACDPDGRLRAATESPSSVTTLRSAAKPFQLLQLVERGHADRFGFGDLELAVMAASHTGSAAHLEVVRGILARIGCAESDLACGFHEPVDAASLREMREQGLPPSPLYNNCSGKHSGMLAMCRAEGWPTQGYERRDHPLQLLLHRTVAEMCDLAPERVERAVDGCSVPVFAVPLDAMARAFARLATARATGDAREQALDRIRRAMVAHPWAVGGRGRFSTALMEAVPDLVAKGGAEGLECAGWSRGGLGIAVKCEDGATRAVAPAMLLALERLGVLPESARAGLEEWRRPRLKNHAGLEVGDLRAELRVEEPAVD